MKFRKFLRILIPVCALAAVSCTNEELILDASQTQRGRDFAEAFKARFENIDPNHTWIDGTVGKVMVTTDEKANIVVYGLGRSDNTALRLKRCVVEGTQEVKYDIPMGCKDIIIRAYNNHANEYRALDPSNENDEVVILLSEATRATQTHGLNAKPRQEIPNVWNQYGAMAPWQTNIPNVPGIICKLDECDHDKARQIATSGDNQWEYYNEDLGLCFYFKADKNVFNDSQYPGDDYWFNMYAPDKPMGYAYWLPTYLFTDDNDFMAKTGLSNGEWAKVIEPGGNHAKTIPLKPDQTYDDASPRWGMKWFPKGEYYVFNPSGKRGSWFNLNHDSYDYGHFYVTNIDISSPATDANSGGGKLQGTTQFYTQVLPSQLANQLQKIVITAESHPEVLKSFNTDDGLTTTEDGEVSVTWFYSETTTRDYVGYYYVKHIDGESKEAYRERCDKAPKYLLLEATCTAGRTQGDTFPLTYYGENGTGSPDFEFPKGYDIHFFVLHGRDSGAKSPNPGSGPNCNKDNWYENNGGWIKDEWETRDPCESYGLNAIVHPEWLDNRFSWLFYDTANAKKQWDEANNRWVDRTSGQANGWTLNPYYCCFSHGGRINDPTLYRIEEMEFGWSDAKFGVPDHRINEWYGGDYRPMVAFQYAGKNVIGFEDTPIEQYNGLDWNDCVFIVNGPFDIPQINNGDLAFSMCMEDLGGTDDLDYNDLYMIVLQGWEEVVAEQGSELTKIVRQTPRVIVDMAGGILPLKITYEDEQRGHLNQTLFDDVHKAFGLEYANDEMKYATVGQRSTINTYDPSSSDPKNPQNAVSVEPAYSPGEISTVTFTDGAIVKCTNVRSLGDPAEYGHIRTNFDESKFQVGEVADFSIIENIPNFKIYVKYNEGESDEETVCISGPKNVQVGGEGKEDKIPYAFWFPSTAPNEEVSEAHPEDRVHPGFERQFIGSYLDGFNEWVANQNLHGQKRWYDWQWGSEKAWPDNKPSSGGTGINQTIDYWTEFTPTYDGKDGWLNPADVYGRNYHLIWADSFKAPEGKKVTEVWFKVNYKSTDNHFIKGLAGSPEDPNEIFSITDSGRNSITKLVSDADKIAALQNGNGIAIVWDDWVVQDGESVHQSGPYQVPASIEIHLTLVDL